MRNPSRVPNLLFLGKIIAGALCVGACGGVIIGQMIAARLSRSEVRTR